MTKQALLASSNDHGGGAARSWPWQPAERPQANAGNHQGQNNDHGHEEAIGPLYWHRMRSSCSTILSATEASATFCCPSAERLSSPAKWRQMNLERYLAGRCLSTSAYVGECFQRQQIWDGERPRNGRDQSGRGKVWSYALQKSLGIRYATAPESRVGRPLVTLL